jgi:hypothetical protein
MPRFSVSGVVQQLSQADWLKPLLAGIFIDGVEVTQVIQYRKAAAHLTDRDDHGPDNSIQLVADKTAYVRVYVQAVFSDVPNVQATVTVQRMRYGVWAHAETLSQQGPGAITALAEPDYATERGTLWNSLNFVIPAARMRGTFRLKVVATAPGRRRAEYTQVVGASLLQTLRVRMIPVHYSGDDLAGKHVDLPAPTMAELQSTVPRTLDWYPVSRTPELSIAGTMNWFVPLAGAIVDGKCPDAWNSLLSWLYLMKMADGNRPGRLYYGLLPSAIPIGGAGGCGGGGAGLGAGPVGRQESMGHELGHVLGFDHAPCGLTNDPNVDLAYPAYEPYDSETSKMASIGEYGFDLAVPAVISPNVGRDFMSYCGPRWPSIYQYKRMLQHSALNPVWIPGPGDTRPPNVQLDLDGPIPHYLPDPPPPWVVDQQVPVLTLMVFGRLVAGVIEVEHIVTLETVPTHAGTPLPGTRLDLIDDDGRIVATAPVRVIETLACGDGAGGCGCSGGGPVESGVICAVIPEPRRGSTLRIVRDDEETWIREPAGAPPRVEGLQGSVEGDWLRMTWQEEVDAYRPLRMLRWSADEGETWQVLACALEAGEATVPVAPLLPGSALIQLIVSDGFDTAVSEWTRVDVPRRAADVSIIAPAAGATVRAGSLIRLAALATDSSGRPLADHQLQWELDGQPVGAGAEVFADLRDYEGDHRAVLIVGDGNDRVELVTDFWASGDGRVPFRRS